MDAANFSGKVALVTGASRGIGRATAVLLGSQGVKIALAARSVTGLAAVQEEIATNGGTSHPLAGDLADPATPARLVREALSTFGRLDILVCNAGIAENMSVAETSVEQWDRLMAVNARAPFLLCREAIPALRESGQGRIVLLCSVVATKGYVNQAAYTASKHALLGFGKVLAQEVHGDGIRVHVISPGGVDTDMVGRMRPDLDRSGLIAPVEIAETILFLLAREGNAVIDEVSVRRTGKPPWA